jgi:hypothetical protein
MSDTSPGSALALFALQAGPRYGETLPVSSPVVTLGRGAQCGVVIADDSVSVQHARLDFDHGSWRITDLDSTNGTSVEGVRLAPQVPTPLPYGSMVRLGGVVLQFRDVPEADPAAARAAFVAPEAPKTLREERRGARFPLWVALLVLVVVAVLAWLYRSGQRTTVSASFPAGAAHASAPAAVPAPPALAA